MLGKKLLQSVVDPQVHHGPVIQPGPAHRLLTDVEPQRADQVEAAAGGGAGPGNVPAVLGDLRLYQYDVQQWVHLAFRLSLYSNSPGNSTVIWSKKCKKIKISPKIASSAILKFFYAHFRSLFPDSLFFPLLVFLSFPSTCRFSCPSTHQQLPSRLFPPSKNGLLDFLFSNGEKRAIILLFLSIFCPSKPISGGILK